MKQRPSGENFLRKHGGFSTLTTVKLGNRFWWKQRTRYQCAPARPEHTRLLSRRWTTFWFWILLGFSVGLSSSMARIGCVCVCVCVLSGRLGVVVVVVPDMGDTEDLRHKLFSVILGVGSCCT